MITIKCKQSKIEITGHAGYAPHGQDIVCASISALLQVFVASIEELTQDKIQSEITAGNAVIEYGDLSERGQVLLDSFFVGIRMIADSYPFYVQLVGDSD